MKKITHTEDKRQPKINTVMNGKGLTVNAGLLPVLNFMDRLHFRKDVKAAVPKERGANARYEFVDAVQMLVIGVISGASAMTQVVAVWADEVLKKMAGWGDVPVDTTLGRIIKLADQSDVVELEALNHRFRGKVWKRLVRSGHKLRSALSVLLIDVDSTVKGVYGDQEGAEKGYNPQKKGQESYHPLMAFVSETKEILHSWFRCGSAYTGNGIVEFMKESMAHIRKGVRVIVRGDSGFFNGELFEYLESVFAGYLIKVKLKNLDALLTGQTWTPVLGDNGWEQTEFQHQCKNWSKPRRFLAVRQLIQIDRGLFDIPVYAYFCYATTETYTAMEAHRKYGERATCETWIEEFKGQMNGAHIKTSEFWANSILFQCAVLAYNIMRWMALFVGGVIRQWEMKTMRLFLVRVAGKLINSGRQLTLKLPEKFLHQAVWQSWEKTSLAVDFG